jgi:hypothetical protein
MTEQIDAIVRAFAPEMERITHLQESKDGKVRLAENWLRSRLQAFETEIRADCASANTGPRADDPSRHHVKS